MRYYLDIKIINVEALAMGTHYRGTETERRALDGYIKLARAAEATGATINDHLRDYGITVSQFGVLEALYHLGPMTAGELGEKILKSSGNMTLVVDNLVKGGLVTRKRRSDDRRCVEVQLTAEGRALLAQLWPQHVKRVVAAFSSLSTEEQEQFAALCRKLGLAQAALAHELAEAAPVTR